MSEPSQSVVKSADRVLDLFELLSRSGDRLSHTDIAESLRIPKSSLSQLLKNLIARGYISNAPNGRGYLLGETLLNLSKNAGLARDLVEQAEPYLGLITAETKESAALNQVKGDVSEVVATVLGPHRLVTHMHLGDVAPLYATSGGKVLLAHFSKDEQEAYLARVTFEEFTPKTIKTTRQLRREIAEIRKSGFGYSIEEYTPGIVGIAMAILDSIGTPLGSINIAMPSTRYDASSKKMAEEVISRNVDGLRRQLERK
jgi:DNA-binding IclR family transcriptional regulator